MGSTPWTPSTNGCERLIRRFRVRIHGDAFEVLVTAPASGDASTAPVEPVEGR
jgi:hypothetical protein